MFSFGMLTSHGATGNLVAAPVKDETAWPIVTSAWL
jgi:hypothetical protein